MNKTYNRHTIPSPLTAEQVDKFLAEQNAQRTNLTKLWSNDAETTRAKMAVYLDAGFTREEAFAMVLKART